MGRRGDESRRGLALPLATFALVCLPAAAWAWFPDDGDRPPSSTAPAAGRSSTPWAVDAPATATATASPAAVGPGAEGRPVAPAPAPGGAGVPSTAVPIFTPASIPPQPPSPSVAAYNTGN
ncbi:hypothetical protein [Yinghuangia sp. YIM S09857]|uniref:hypothetical protein n=1 Tax=Yinghuangia sp. YIM S09857 TaxID=3436929 RepID=UPI003F5307B2